MSTLTELRDAHWSRLPVFIGAALTIAFAARGWAPAAVTAAGFSLVGMGLFVNYQIQESLHSVHLNNTIHQMKGTRYVRAPHPFGVLCEIAGTLTIVSGLYMLAFG